MDWSSDIKLFTTEILMDDRDWYYLNKHFYLSHVQSYVNN